MSQFVLIAHDGPEGPARRDAHREPHVAHVEALHREGRIVYAGPIKSDDGSTSVGVVIILEAPDLDAARQVVEADPYVAGGVFASLELAPIKQVFPPPA